MTEQSLLLIGQLLLFDNTIPKRDKGYLRNYFCWCRYVTYTSQSFNELHALLNVVREAEQITDNRIDKLQKIEKQIGNFLSENFPKSKIEIDIPKPELKQVFANARILIDDGVRDIIETKGDGIKRTVTFALLRTYVESPTAPWFVEKWPL